MKSLSDDGNGNVKVKRQAENMPRAISFQSEKDGKRVRERESKKDEMKTQWQKQRYQQRFVRKIVWQIFKEEAWHHL